MYVCMYVQTCFLYPEGVPISDQGLRDWIHALLIWSPIAHRIIPLWYSSLLPHNTFHQKSRILFLLFNGVICVVTYLLPQHSFCDPLCLTFVFVCLPAYYCHHAQKRQALLCFCFALLCFLFFLLDWTSCLCFGVYFLCTGHVMNLACLVCLSFFLLCA